ncbi:hypothetical protein [Antrihabitans sp. YC2-6]|uniref:hypothetical protein n=1 Tax=Antrihabitans sp. YC2-6 TaxID=2799498 RepID=UPI0018F3517C|nr:hypothetical protein [Antrihabitans sp. YC2-6]MBJ8344829.1 hypothetical protein [Antrihabitans sp. YC2-6]
MSRRRGSRPCQVCGRSTRSITYLCADHRPIDAVPAVTLDGSMVAIAGLTFTAQQALRVADMLVDAAEECAP